MRYRFGQWQSGQSMVEMVVAIGMVALVLVAIVSGITLSVRNSRFSKSKAIATRYAQETVEKFRHLRDEIGWEPFVDEVLAGNASRTYCFPDLPESSVNLGEFVGECTSEKIINSSGETEFMREAVASMNNGAVEMTVTVLWAEGSKTHQVELTSRLNEWSLQ